MKPLRLTLSKTSHVSFSSIGLCCGSVRVSGWITGDNKLHIFSMCAVAAERLGVPHLGAFVMDKDTTGAPFAHDIKPAYISRKGRQGWSGRMEELSETLERVQKHVAKVCRQSRKTVATV